MAKRKLYRAKVGGWVNGTYWPAGRTAHLYDIQAEAYVPAILEELGPDGKPVVTKVPKNAAPTPQKNAPAKIVNLPPVSAQRPRRRVSGTVGVSAKVAGSQLALSQTVTKSPAKSDDDSAKI